MVNSGSDLEGVVLDESTTKQVNVRDALVLARGGILIPEQNIYYKDDDIEYDEDIDELVVTTGIVNLSWEEKAKRVKEFGKKVRQTGRLRLVCSLKSQKLTIG